MAKIKIDNLPLEVMIEVEPRCNFNCQFCFNKISFAKNGRNIRPFSAIYVKKIIDGIVKAGIKIVRFTGGEPLLRKDIFELMKYAKNKDLEVRLNTNGSLITQNTARKLNGAVDNVLIPIESYSNKIEEQMTGFHQSLKKKIIAVELLKKNKIPIVRAGTVASSASIKNFDKMAKLIFSLPIDEWEFYRPISNSQNRQTLIKSKDINFLVNKIHELKRKTGRIISIANSIPFCSVKNRGRIAGVSSGALFDDGHNRLVVDPRGFVKPHYFIDKNIGNPLNILGAWNHPFMKRMRNLKYLPKACRTCDFKFKCRGGSRHEAKIAFGSYRALDPLARPKVR